MQTVISKDGTPIAFDRSSEGAPIILVVGALNDRATGRPREHREQVRRKQHAESE